MGGRVEDPEGGARLTGRADVKNQYFGDISDYRKYGLLRCLSEQGLRVGVLWMLTEDDGRNDGARTAYLGDPDRWRRFDPPLFDLLADTVVHAPDRSVARFEASGLLADGLYHSELLGDLPGERRNFFDRASESLKDADVIFLDPDNGIEVKSVARGAKNSRKYVYWMELERLWNEGHSLLVFQHFTREPRDAITRRLTADLSARTNGAQIAALTTSHVLFLSAAQDEHAERVTRALGTAIERWPGQIAG